MANQVDRNEASWECRDVRDGVYYVTVHIPCGTEVLTPHQFQPAPKVCPTCQPNE